MNCLRRMLHDLKLRNYAESTQRNYVQNVARFANYFGRSPTKLGADEVREFQLHLLEQDVSWSHFNGHVSALRFFYGITLNQRDVVERIPFGKKECKLPILLTVDEVVQIVQAAPTILYRTLFLTMYGTGMRLDEARRLSVDDVDSTRMVIRVRKGKRRKDRFAPLSAKLLLALRNYWKVRHPDRWLFPGAQPNRPISKRAVQRAFAKTRKRARINKPVSTHALRHACATHLLEAGTDIRVIQKLLGHAFITTTLRYTQVTNRALQLGVSPLDHIDGLM